MNSTAQTNVPADSQQSTQTIQKLQDEIAKLEKQQTDQEKELQKQKQQANVAIDSLQQVKPVLNSQSVSNQVNPAGSRDKERQEQIVGSPSPEHAPVREISVEFEPTQELKDWIEPVPDPQSVTLPKSVIKDDYGEILIQATHIPRPKIFLPLDKVGIEKGMHHRVFDSIRWLAEWCHRNIRLYPGRVFYKHGSDSKA